MLATAIKICEHVNSHARKLDEWMHPQEQDETLIMAKVNGQKCS